MFEQAVLGGEGGGAPDMLSADTCEGSAAHILLVQMLSRDPGKNPLIFPCNK